MKVLMLPHPKEGLGNESGIRRVVEAYHKHLPKFGVELVRPDATTYDIKAVHAGMTGADNTVCHTHGLYWTSDYKAPEWEYRVNARVIEAIRYARIVTVPSDWVAESFRRDMRINPAVVPHGIDWKEWQHDEPNEGYILWNKNRAGIDACDNTVLTPLAKRFPGNLFVTTFPPPHMPPNIKMLKGVVPHAEMKKLVQRSSVYLSLVKETFGIGVLEAMAAGVPVLGWNYGGNSFLISHGVNGYLVEPGNLDDLYTGLAYCLQYRDTLGANGRELVKRWNWETACEKLITVYEQALQPEPATVSVVIPVYNKSIEQVERAVKSAYNQAYKPKSIIIIDDGSTNGIYDDLCRLRTIDENTINVFRIENQGVANARNYGISFVDSTYICCLDSDDWIEPDFLSYTVQALEQDRSLGIAYTGLKQHGPDGQSSISSWPPDFDYDQQLNRRNQVPTCCVFRRDAWVRTGGYRSRYCPNGAGSEDAAFWTAIGSIGYGAKKVTDEPLFNYSAGGQVSGDKNYREVDWLCMYPWVKDGKHPFASVATPARHSHPVRQYDQPEISVIIPVGPGHERTVINALDSLEMQHFRKWEAIVVLDTTLEINELKQLKQAYPYVKFTESFDKNIVSNGKGFMSKGAGAARNLGASIARAPFLFFLDADDVLNQPDALDKFLIGWQQEEAIIYSDYLGKSSWPRDKAEAEFGARLLGYIDRTGQAVVSYKSAEYDYERAIQEPKYNPNNPKMPYYLWCTVSVLIPKAWHDAIGGFDESMATWEDVDYFWRLAREGYCFRRVPEPLMLYNYDSGHRREASIPRDKTSRQNHQNMINYIIYKYKQVQPKMCNCRGKRSAVTTPETIITGELRVANGQHKDDDFRLIEFTPNYVGNRQLVGAATRIKYGYSRQPGDRFLVHVNDIAAQPHMFQIVPEKVEPPKVEIELPQPPEPIESLAPPEPVAAVEVPKPRATRGTRGRKRK